MCNGELMAYSLRIVLIVLLLCSVAVNANPKEKAPEATLVVSISVSDQGFESDANLSIGGGHCGGYALVMVNDEPIAVHMLGGSLQPIGQWGKKGQNVVRIIGEFEEPLYVKVAWQKRDGSINVIGKKKFEPRGLKASRITFELDHEFQLPRRELLPEDDKKLNADGQEVRKITLRIQELIREGKGEPAAEQLLKGQHVWMREVHGTSEKALDDGKHQLSQMLTDKDFQLVPEDKDRDFYIISGETCIFVYRADVKWDEFPSSFRLINKAGEVRAIPPLRFVKIDGKWVIW